MSDTTKATPPREETARDTSKKRFKLPDIYIILGTFILVMAALTYVIPAGEYERQLVETAKGVQNLIITLGGNGSVAAGKNGMANTECVKMEHVADTTAAGDTLCGGLCVFLSEGKTLEEACAFGSKAASIACTRAGAQQSVPTRKETENY